VCPGRSSGALLFPSPATLSASISPPTRRFADDQEVVLGPAIRFQVRLSRLVVIGVLRVTTRTTALSPGPNFGSLMGEDAITNVPPGNLAAIFGLDVPLEGQGAPVPAIPPWTLLTRELLPSFLNERKSCAEQPYQCSLTHHRKIVAPRGAMYCP
jgi:hypothetical protein